MTQPERFYNRWFATQGFSWDSVTELMEIVMETPVANYRRRQRQFEEIAQRCARHTCGCDHGDEDTLNRVFVKLAMSWERLTDDERCELVFGAP